jgi:hypothetical protein
MVRPVLIALVAALAAAVSPAAATKPCWQRLIDDYSDGRIDRTYPVACYNQALAHLPEDVRVYSTAEDDIHRALLTSAARKQTVTRAAAEARPAPTAVPRRVVAPRRQPVTHAQPRRPDLERGALRTAAARGVEATSIHLPLAVLVSAIGGAVLVAAGGASALRRRLLR